MKKINTILLIVILGSSCNSPDSWDIFKSTGHSASVTRSLDDFNRIVIDENFEFQVILQDTISKIEIIAGKNILPKIKTKVENGILTVNDNNKYNFFRSYSRIKRLKIYTKNLLGLQTNTGRDFYVMGPPDRKIDSLLIRMPESSGDLSLNITTGRLKLILRESVSKITAIGNADSLFYESGYSFGPVDMKSFAVKYAKINQTGSNNMWLNVQDSLNVTIKGIGNVYYIGNPLVKVSDRGFGLLIKE